MNKVQILRVETESCVGPYRNSRLNFYDHDKDHGQPAPTDDALLCSNLEQLIEEGFGNDRWEVIQGNIFGFLNLEQLNNWFNNRTDRVALYMHDYNISIYEINASNIIHGDTQIIYDKQDTEFIRSVTFTKGGYKIRESRLKVA